MCKILCNSNLSVNTLRTKADLARIILLYIYICILPIILSDFSRLFSMLCVQNEPMIGCYVIKLT